MESGTNRQVVTTNILNSTTRGSAGYWSINNALTNLLVSTEFEQMLPGLVSIAGTLYDDIGSTRTFVFTNTTFRQFATYNFYETHPKLSFGLFLRVSGFGELDHSFDLVAIEAGGDFFVVNFQDRGSGLALRTHTLDEFGVGPGGPGLGVPIPIEQDKTYWATGLWDSENLVATLEVYDSATWSLVGTSTNTILNHDADNISFGRYDDHETAIENASVYFDDLVWDVSGMNFPILPESLGNELGNRPKVTIKTPTNGSLFRAGQLVEFEGNAEDIEDGRLAAHLLHWNIAMRDADYRYPINGNWNTNRGELRIPTTGHPFGHDTSYELTLVATDSSGLQGSASVVINPELVDISVDSVPSGMTVKMDGISRVTPFTDGSVIGFQHSLEAGDQAAFGTNYIFETWNDGGGPVRSVTIPEQDLHLSAHYRVGAPGELLIQRAALEGDVFRIRFNTLAGRTYVVEHSPTMAAGTWTPAGEVVIGTGSSVEVVDPIGNLHPSGFYRVTAQPNSIRRGVPACAASVEAHGLDVKSVSVDVPSTGDNRLLLVGICWIEHGTDELPSPMLGGVPLTQVVVTNWFYDSGKLAWYALPAPAVGTRTLQVSFATAVAELAVVGMEFTNVDQVVSLGEPASRHAQLPIPSIAVDVPSTTNDLVVDLLGYYAYDPAPGSGQIFRQASINSGNASAQTSVKPGQTVSTPMSWSLSDATEIALLGIAVKGR